jgi:hypothetical protein
MLSSGSRINSVDHQLSCFGVGFSLCLITGGLFLCLAPFLWGKISDPSVGPQLSEYCDGLLINFQFFSVVWLQMFLTGLGGELCRLLPALFQVAAYQMPTVSPSAFPAFVYLKFTWRSAPCSSSLLQCAFINSVPLLCVSFHFLIFCSFFFAGMGEDQSAQGAILVYPRGGWEKTMWCFVLTCWSAKCLSGRFGASIWQHSSPPVFSV